MERTTTIIKILGVLFTLLGLAGFILASGTSTKVGEAQATVKELVALKDKKQKCKDSLNYQETIEEYKGILHCGEDDERIAELKKILSETLLNDYEQVDSIIMQKQLEKISNGETSSYEKLTAFLESE